MRQAFVVGVIAGSLSLAGAASTQAQTVKVDVKIQGNLARELREALREVTIDLSGIAREVSREIGREIPGLANVLGDVVSHVARDITRDVTRDLGRDLGRNLGNSGREVGREFGREFSRFPEGAWDQDRNFRAEVVDRETKTLGLGPTSTLEIHNLSGDITVSVGREASVEIIRRSHGRSDADARLGLERVKMDVKILRGARAAGDRAILRSNYSSDRRPPYSVSIDLIVTAPVGTRLIIDSISGDVQVNGVRGELSVNTISGDVTLVSVGSVSEAKTASGDVTITGADVSGSLDAQTLSGDVVLTNVKAGRVRGSSVSGSVTGRNVTADAVTFTTMSGDTLFSGELSNHGRYEFTSHVGDVTFAPIGSTGYTLTITSVMGEVSSSLGLSFTGGSSRRGPRGATVGDGSASVTLTTFNGDVVIKK